MESILSWTNNTDKYFALYLPIHTSTLIFDTLHKVLTGLDLNKTIRYETELFKHLESKVQKGDISDFKKLGYTIPKAPDLVDVN